MPARDSSDITCHGTVPRGPSSTIIFPFRLLVKQADLSIARGIVLGQVIKRERERDVKGPSYPLVSSRSNYQTRKKVLKEPKHDVCIIFVDILTFNFKRGYRLC